jgi:urease accessory protein
MQISDSAFPTGAFTHSNGLETFVQHGAVYDLASLERLIQTQLLHSLCYSDMIVLHSAASAHDDPSQIFEMDYLLSAAKTARETFEASSKIGRRMLLSALALLDDAGLKTYQSAVRDGRCAGHQAIVYGLTYAALGLDARSALLAYGYGVVAGQISAAVKLLSLGQTPAQQLIHRLQPVIEEAASTALGLTLEDFQTFSPGLDIRCMQHQFLFRRLFVS